MDITKENALLTLHEMTVTRVSLQNRRKYIMHGLVKMNVWLECIFIRLGSLNWIDKLLGFHCAPQIADSFLFCYERDFMMSLSDDQ